MPAVLLLVLGTVPFYGPVETTVDSIEVNHFFDENGKPIFSQIILWEHSEQWVTLIAWRLLKCSRMVPVRRGEFYEVLWHDGVILRRVRSRAWFETWTQYDPELLARNKMPRDSRRELGGEVGPIPPWLRSIKD